MVSIASLAPNATNLAKEIEEQARNNPAQRGQFDSLKQTLDQQTSGFNGINNLSGINKFEKLLASDATFKEDVRRLALQNPAALEKIVPALLQNPNGMKQLITTTAAANPSARAAPEAAAPAAAKNPAPAAATANTNTAQRRAAPAEPAAVAAPAAQAAPAAAPAAATAASAQPAAAAPDPDKDPLNTFAQKMEQLKQIPGYEDLNQRIQGNPQLSGMFSSMMDPSKDAAGADSVLDSVLNRAGKTPAERAESTLLTDLVKTIDEKPGMVSSIASNFANDPKTGMMMIGMYSQFNQGFGKMLDGLMGPGALDGMLTSLMSVVGKFLGQSGGLMNMSNNGGGLLQQVMGGLGVNPNAQISAVAPENGDVTTTSAAQYAAAGNAPKAGTQAALDQTQRERNPNQNPAGPQPASPG